MRPALLALSLLAGWAGISLIQAAPANSPNAAASPPVNPAAPAGSSSVAAANAASLARLTASNQDLLDLLKKQQAVLEDIQYDRRLQNRQISSLEDRLQDAMQQNGQLQAKVAKLEMQLSLAPSAPIPAAVPPAKAVSLETPPPAAAPAAPATYLPPPESEGAPGTKSWHRLFSLSGTEGKESQLFHVQGPQWRVLWHNQDRPGDSYVNTSALFINAYPKGDNIPIKVCSKLGSGGDKPEFNGPGDFSLKIEASGGTWELAVEDFR